LLITATLYNIERTIQQLHALNYVHHSQNTRRI
jgi:hypothetical protein